MSGFNMWVGRTSAASSDMVAGTSAGHDEERALSGLIVPDVPQWMGDALCAQTDPEEFFPDKGGSSKVAKRVCSSCLVKSDCLAYALEHRERFGIWGGMSERERRRVLAKKKAS